MVIKNIRTQLGLAVRSIQWSYAIVWSVSTAKQGVLEWSDGYYNGDIKTRKTVTAMEISTADEEGLERSEQLRDLYKFLLEGEPELDQPKRPYATLSPEDLTEAEWYYLVCMSFEFKKCEGLPGRALASNETIWLCNAQYSDSKLFSRSLLARSASIQTVVCLPYLDGIVEIGTTELVSEDHSLLQRFKAYLLDFSKPVCFDKSSSTIHKADNDKDPAYSKVGQSILDALTLENLSSPTKRIELDQDLIKQLDEENTIKLRTDSLDECENDFENPCQKEDSFTLEDFVGGVSQVHSQHLLDCTLSNGVEDSMSSYCVCEASINQQEPSEVNRIRLNQVQDFNHSKLRSLNIGADNDLHYLKTVSAILRNSSQLIRTPSISSPNCKSSFTVWAGTKFAGHRAWLKQNLLKKILRIVPLMYNECARKLDKIYGCREPVLISDDIRETEKFQVLKSMVPSITEMDNTSVLGDTIKYLKELEARVEEIESCIHSADTEARPRSMHRDVMEQKLDNHTKYEMHRGKTSWISKRKVCEIDESEPHVNWIVEDNLPLYVKVNVKGHGVLIEMKCAYKGYILLDVMDALNNLHLDAHSVQSSTDEGVLHLKLKAKFRGSAVAPVAMIKEAIQKIVGKR